MNDQDPASAVMDPDQSVRGGYGSMNGSIKKSGGNLSPLPG
ncbi:hypothetical protein [Endozoicomonas sp.]